MNVSSVKTVLCYGDSNTHGQIPASYSRYPLAERWTGILQGILGNGYYVIEEGLGGRTVNLDEPNRPGRNGYDYFLPCLSSHQPLDQVIIMLSTNDLKVQFNRSVDDIVQGLNMYIQAAKQYSSNIFLVSPVVLNPEAPQWTFFGGNSFDESSAYKSKELVGRLGDLAAENGCNFIAASSVAEPSVDGIHLDKAGHQALAEAIASDLRA